MTICVRICVFLFAGLSALAQFNPVQAQNDSPALLNEVNSLDKWLGTDANGNTWRSYLLLKKLQAEVGGDREANPAVLFEVWRRFASGEAGLEGPRFQKVKTALEQYLNNRLRLSRDQVAAAAKEVKFAAPANDVIAKAVAEARTAATQVNAQINQLPRNTSAAARKHFGDQTLRDLAAGKNVEVARLDALALALDRYHWRVYDKQYIQLVPGLQYRNETEIPALEGANYTRLRAAVRRLRNLQATAGDADGAKSLQSAVDELVANLPKAADQVGKEYELVAISKQEEPLPLPPIAKAAAALKKLQMSGQAPQLGSAAAIGFSHPNLVGYVSRDFLGGGLEQDIDRVQPVNDNILGTSIHGTAHVRGRTDVRMLTNPDQAGYRILLGATANSSTVGYNGPVTILSTGVTQLKGEKKIHFDDEIGGMAPSPATATASTCTSINSICARSRLVERIAWKRASASKGEAEAIASGNAAARLRGEMDQQARESTSQVNSNFEKKYRRPLIIRNEYPKQFLTASSSELMQVVIAQQGLGQLGAPDAPPAPPASDLTLQLHESYVSNFSRAMLGGQEFTSLELRQLQESMGGEIKSIEQLAKERADRSGEGTEPNIPETIESLADTFLTFDDEFPIRVEFRGDQVLIVVRVKKLESRVENEDPKAPEERLLLVRGVEITALYKLGEVEGAPALIRNNEVGVNAAFLEKNPGPGEDANRRRLGKRRITDRFREDVFPETIKLSPLDFSKRKAAGNKQSFGNWSKLPPLPLDTAVAKSGWLTLGWSFPEEPARTVEKKAEPKVEKPAN